MLSDLRADAVLAQDLGVLSLIAREFLHLCVHASTQMALHNVAGARLARSLGMRRVVLARECTLDAIRAEINELLGLLIFLLFFRILHRTYL